MERPSFLSSQIEELASKKHLSLSLDSKPLLVERARVNGLDKHNQNAPKEYYLVLFTQGLVILRAERKSDMAHHRVFLHLSNQIQVGMHSSFLTLSCVSLGNSLPLVSLSLSGSDKLPALYSLHLELVEEPNPQSIIVQRVGSMFQVMMDIGVVSQSISTSLRTQDCADEARTLVNRILNKVHFESEKESKNLVPSVNEFCMTEIHYLEKLAGNRVDEAELLLACFPAMCPASNIDQAQSFKESFKYFYGTRVMAQDLLKQLCTGFRNIDEVPREAAQTVVRIWELLAKVADTLSMFEVEACICMPIAHGFLGQIGERNPKFIAEVDGWSDGYKISDCLVLPLQRYTKRSLIASHVLKYPHLFSSEELAVLQKIKKNFEEQVAQGNEARGHYGREMSVIETRISGAKDIAHPNRRCLADLTVYHLVNHSEAHRRSALLYVCNDCIIAATGSSDTHNENERKQFVGALTIEKNGEWKETQGGKYELKVAHGSEEHSPITVTTEEVVLKFAKDERFKLCNPKQFHELISVITQARDAATTTMHLPSRELSFFERVSPTLFRRPTPVAVARPPSPVPAAAQVASNIQKAAGRSASPLRNFANSRMGSSFGRTSRQQSRNGAPTNLQPSTSGRPGTPTKVMAGISRNGLTRNMQPSSSKQIPTKSRPMRSENRNQENV